MGNIITNSGGKWFLRNESGKVLLRGRVNESFSEFDKRCSEYKNSKKKDSHESWTEVEEEVEEYFVEDEHEKYLLATPLLAHAEELKNQLKVMADLFHYDFPRSFCAEIRAVDSLLAKITAEERKQNETLQINE